MIFARLKDISKLNEKIKPEQTIHNALSHALMVFNEGKVGWWVNAKPDKIYERFYHFHFCRDPINDHHGPTGGPIDFSSPPPFNI